MTWLRPRDPRALAARAADALVIATDPDARGANPFYWHRLTARLEAITETLRSVPDPATAAAVQALLTSPAEPGAHRRLTRNLAAAGRTDPPWWEDLTRKAWELAHHGRIGHHLGSRATGRPAPHRPEDPGRTGLDDPRAGLAGQAAQIVVPFRDAGPTRDRLANLLACLQSLRDQSPVAGGYTVTVVETDERPRWRERITGLADEYLFARHTGPFNRAWAVNVGVTRSAVRADTVCVFDADLLADRDFVRRNVRRFEHPGVGAVLPYQDLLYLDAPSSALAVHQRLVEGTAAPRPATLRGFPVRRAVGACMWVLREVFEQVNGMDERYEGWGGEDMEFVLRLQLARGVNTFQDLMPHLHHPVSVQLAAGETRNVGIPWFSWPPDIPIGRPDRYSAPHPAPAGP